MVIGLGTSGMRLGIWNTVLVAAAVAVRAPSASAADRIVLRNLDVIAGRTVTAFDEDGVRLDDGSVLTWDAIERARIGPERQAAFDQMLESLGTHLYRIRQRLAVGDYRGILPHAEAVYARYIGRRSSTAYMVFQGLMWARIAAGRREAAVEPYLRCYEYLRSARAGKIALPGKRRLAFDRETGMTPELPPVWFDPQAARAALPGVYRAVADMAPPRPGGTRVYYGTLALAAGERKQALEVLSGIADQRGPLAELRAIAMAQAEVLAGAPGPAVRTLAADHAHFSPDNRPLAVYWLGMAKLAASDPGTRREGILELLRLPAVYGERFPELAAAALYQAMLAFDAAGERASRDAVRRELLERYGQTYHAAKWKAHPRVKGKGS